MGTTKTQGEFADKRCFGHYGVKGYECHFCSKEIRCVVQSNIEYNIDGTE